MRVSILLLRITPKKYRALLRVNKSVNFCTREHPNRKRLCFKCIGLMRSRDGIKYIFGLLQFETDICFDIGTEPYSIVVLGQYTFPVTKVST